MSATVLHLPLHHSREYLHEQYINQRRSTTDIANECGVSSKAISNSLARHNIQARPRVGTNLTGTNLTGTNHEFRRIIDRHIPTGSDRKAPSLVGSKTPAPGESQLLRIDSDWWSDDRLLLIVQPHHTWGQVANLIVDRFFASTSPHLWKFVFSADRTPMSHWWSGPDRLPEYDSSTGTEVSYETHADEDPYGPYSMIEPAEMLYATDRVNETIGHGNFGWFVWDFGTSWHFGVRGCGIAPPQARRDLPEIIHDPNQPFIAD